MAPYVYIEYPKCMYDANGNTMTVDNREEEDAAAAMGWMDAAKKHNYPIETTRVVVDEDNSTPPVPLVPVPPVDGGLAEEPAPVVGAKTPLEFDEGF
jgi:hypothetical protein